MNKHNVALLFRIHVFRIHVFLIISVLAPSIAHAVEIPRDVRGTLVRSADIKFEWSRINDAQRYQVNVNGAFAGTTNEIFFYSRNLAPGDYSVTIQAIYPNGRYSSPSQKSAPINVGGGSSKNSNNTDSRSTESDNGSINPPDGLSAEILDRSKAKIRWNAPSGNIHGYNVYINGGYKTTVKGPEFEANNLNHGEDYKVSVVAISKSQQFSRYSNALTVNTANGSSVNVDERSDNGSGSAVNSPGDVRGTQVGDNEVKWEWANVQGASGYEVFVDGASKGITKEDFMYTGDLSVGDHSAAVSAIDSEGRKSAQSAAVVVNVSGDLSGGNNNVAPPPPAQDDNGLIDPASWNYSEVSQKPGYQLVFSDEFNTNALNRARWNTQLRWDGSYNGERYEYRLINGESQFYVNIFSDDQEHLNKIVPVHNPFEFNGERLAIRAVRNPLKNHSGNAGHGPLGLISTQQPFLSGAISTYDKFKQKYGYFEARIKIPAHVGTFPAFWLHHQKRESEGTQKTEIDIMENLGHAPWYVYTAMHYFTGVREGVTGTAHSVKPQPQGQIHTGTIYSDNYHVYAAEWKPGHVRYLIDGQQVSEVWNGAVDHEELYLIINMAIGGIWTNMRANAGGTGRSADNRFPTQQDINEWGNPALEIDYVRVYKAR